MDIHLTTKTWNDLSKREVIHLFQILTEGNGSGLYTPLLNTLQRLRAFYYLAQLSPDEIQAWERADTLDPDDALDGNTLHAYSIHQASVEMLADIIRVDADNPTQHHLVFGRTKPIYPELKVKTSPRKVLSLYSPAEGWDNLSIYEMAHAFTLLQNYDEDRNPTHLHRLFATLYRPAKPTTEFNRETNYQGDRRIPYREHGEYSVEARMPHFAKLNPAALNLLAFWAMSCRKAIIDAYPRVFKPRKESDVDRHPNDYGWAGVLLSIAEGVVHLDKVAEQNCHTVLAYLSKLEDERLEREMWGK